MHVPYKIQTSLTTQTGGESEFVGLVEETKYSSLRLDFLIKIANSHDITFPRDLLQELAAETCPQKCADFREPDDMILN